MREDLTELATLDRAQVLAATDHHPYARLTTSARELRGFAGPGVTAWLSSWSRGVVASALGEPEAAVRLFAALAERSELAGVRRVNLPRLDRRRLADHLPAGEVDEWDFRWAWSPPPAQPGEQRVQVLEPPDAPAIEELLTRAFPGTFTRPGDPQVRRWYGIWEAGRLVACAADRSRGGVGSISAVTVDADRQGRGLGAALTAAMTRELFAGSDVVTLGVMSDNERADRLYRRLGFRESSPRSSAALTH